MSENNELIYTPAHRKRLIELFEKNVWQVRKMANLGRFFNADSVINFAIYFAIKYQK